MRGCGFACCGVLDGGVLAISDTKRHKSRFVPLHSSAVRALEAYAHQRDLRVLSPRSNRFFLLDNGKPLHGRTSRAVSRNEISGRAVLDSPED